MCVLWDLIITDVFMNDTFMKNYDQTYCLWTDMCQKIFGLKTWHSDSIFLIFKAILTLFLSSQHLVYDSVGLHRCRDSLWCYILQNSETGKNECWIVKSEWLSNTKSFFIFFILSTRRFVGHILQLCDLCSFVSWFCLWAKQDVNDEESQGLGCRMRHFLHSYVWYYLN